MHHLLCMDLYAIDETYYLLSGPITCMASAFFITSGAFSLPSRHFSLCFWLPIDSDVHALAFSLSGCAASTSSSGLLSNRLDTVWVVTVIPSGLVFSLSNICSTLNGSIYLLSSFRKAWVRGVQYYPCPCSWKKKRVVHPRFLPSELVSSFYKEDT